MVPIIGDAISYLQLKSEAEMAGYSGPGMLHNGPHGEMSSKRRRLTELATKNLLVIFSVPWGCRAFWPFMQSLSCKCLYLP